MCIGQEPRQMLKSLSGHFMPVRPESALRLSLKICMKLSSNLQLQLLSRISQIWLPVDSKSTDIIYGPLKHVHVDLAGPFEVAATRQSPKHKERILLMVDYFTKLAEFEPISDKSSSNVSRVFMHSWVYRYGAPEHVTSDNGTGFQAEFNALLSRLGVQHLFTSIQPEQIADDPQANGAVERLVRSSKEALSRHIGNQYSAWKDSLPALRFAQMLKMHSATGFAPFKLLMGHKPVAVLPSSISSMHLTLNTFHGLRTHVQQLQDLLGDLQELKSNRKQQLKAVAVYNAKRAGSRPLRPLRVGDLVLEPIKTPGSLMAKALGPFKVMAFTNSGDSAVLRPATSRYKASQTYTRHTSRLARHLDRHHAAHIVYSRPDSSALGGPCCLSAILFSSPS